MFAQANVIHVPMGAMPRLRQLIESEYLPQLRQRDGFISAYLLEQIDDPECGLLMVYWDSQQSVEAFHRTGVLQASVQALAAVLPGVKVERESFLVTVNAAAERQPAAAGASAAQS